MPYAHAAMADAAGVVTIWIHARMAAADSWVNQGYIVVVHVLRGERVLIQKRGILYLKCNLYTRNHTKLVHKSNFPS